MTQSYMNEAVAAFTQERDEERIALHASSERPPSTSEGVATRSFVLALWSSVLLGVLGVALIYHSPMPTGGLLFMSGCMSIVAAMALSLSARSRLLSRFERHFKAQNMSDVAARHQARLALEAALDGRQISASDCTTGAVVERLPLS